MKRTRSSALLLLALASFSRTCAALRFDATLDPIRVEARPGQNVNRTFRLTLAKDEARTQFRACVQDWWRSEDGRQSFYRPPGTLARSCAPWIKLNPVEAAVGPGETLDVRVSIAVPTDVKPGGYWCALTVDQVQDPLAVQPDGIGVRFLASLSVGIFVFVGPVERAARILDVQVDGGEACVKLRNDGNCPLRVEGRFEFLAPGASKPTATTSFPSTTLVTVPVNTTMLRAALPDQKRLPPGRYLVRAILDIGIDHYIGVQKEMDIGGDAASGVVQGASR